jgi:hypothetical protein
MYVGRDIMACDNYMYNEQDLGALNWIFFIDLNQHLFGTLGIKNPYYPQNDKHVS